jgi:hypothetical protein
MGARFVIRGFIKKLKKKGDFEDEGSGQCEWSRFRCTD